MRILQSVFPAGRFSRLLLPLIALTLVGGGPAPAEPADPGAVRLGLEQLSQTFRTVYQQARPAVVLITTTRRWSTLRDRLPPFHPGVPEEEELPGLGSGIVVSPEGYLLSNYHVVEGADSILVTLDDRRIFEAEVVGFDSLIDIALLKIEAEGLAVARLGDADSLQIGDWVLAIGHPLGMGSTLTHGIVSALNRQAQIIEDDYGIESFIQTNAVINPGNSGGPLLNLRGEVIGINTAISTRTGYYIGYGLAVPINLAQEAMEDILTYGRVVRGYLGVSMQEVDQGLIQRLGLELEHPQGIYINRVFPDSPAARSDLKFGDVILTIDGHLVDHPNQVQTLIYDRDPGDSVELTLIRDGVRQRLNVVLGEREEDRLLARGRERISRLGLTVAPLSRERAAELGLTEEVAAELGLETGEQAVVVVAVDPDGPAAARGINVDDVITEIDEEKVTSASQFLQLVAALRAGESSLFWLWRPELGVDLRMLEITD